MADALRRQRDLFESSPAPMSISINAQEQMLELLKVLLTEALAGPAETDHVGGEDGGEQDHA
jgi:hypothetical protein